MSNKLRSSHTLSQTLKKTLKNAEINNCCNSNSSIKQKDQWGAKMLPKMYALQMPTSKAGDQKKSSKVSSQTISYSFCS